MEIYLVRHGAAHTKEDDPERHLNKDGLAQVGFGAVIKNALNF